MIRLVVALALVWLALLPPLFTNGACDAEFDRVGSQVEKDRKALASPTLAQGYWAARQVPGRVISAEQCRVSRLRFIESCGAGELLYVSVPVQNRVCRFYRDSGITVQLHYDGLGRLSQLRTDMNPFKFLPLPWLGITLNWAR
jgi:hypothetical protein